MYRVQNVMCNDGSSSTISIQAVVLVLMLGRRAGDAGLGCTPALRRALQQSVETVPDHARQHARARAISIPTGVALKENPV